MEWKLFTGDVPHVSTFEFHEHRERAAHLEDEHHRERLLTAARMIRDARGPLSTLSDLGCGDGGLLSLVKDDFPDGRAWGYDFAPANQAGWEERGIHAAFLDVFGRDRDKVDLGSIVACTEVLEHVADPHGILRWLYESPATDSLVCSSPLNETAEAYEPCHAWAWDGDGYAAVIRAAGWRIAEHVGLKEGFQVVRADKRNFLR